MPANEQQETTQRPVRSEDPGLSPEANAALTEELQEALGADRVSMPADAEDPGTARRSGDSQTKATLVSMRPLLIITLAVALVVGVIISLATGSWWALVAAAAVHAVGTMVVASGAIQATTEIEHASPETSARLEEEGVADPDRVLSDLVEDYSGGAESSPAGGVISAGDTSSRSPAAERRAMTPGAPASGESSVVAALPWLIVTSLMVLSLIFAIIDGGKMWATPAIMVPLGAAWIAMDRHLNSRNEQQRSPGPGRFVVIATVVVGGVVLFMSIVRLLIG